MVPNECLIIFRFENYFHIKVVEFYLHFSRVFFYFKLGCIPKFCGIIECSKKLLKERELSE